MDKACIVPGEESFKGSILLSSFHKSDELRAPFEIEPAHFTRYFADCQEAVRVSSL
jgi:hypothetical protein